MKASEQLQEFYTDLMNEEILPPHLREKLMSLIKQVDKTERALDRLLDEKDEARERAYNESLR
jgi:hypothetical protein